MKRLLSVALAALLLAAGAVWQAFADTVMLPMKDSTKLATEVVLPASGGPAFPAVLVRTVYNKNAVVAGAALFTDQGFALVAQDARGRFASEGKDYVFQDDGWGAHQDGADTVDWIKRQPWCNGKIGTWGMSALGITQVRLAPVTRDVAGQAIVVAASNFYGQIAYQGGVFIKSLSEQWVHGQKSDWVIDTWKNHPLYDDYWKEFNAEPLASKVTSPGIHIGGWFDIFQQGTINNFVTRQHNGGAGAKGNQKLIMGPWPHGPKKNVGDLTFRDNFNKDFVGASNRFLKYWVAGEQNGVMDEPAVEYYTLGDVEADAAPGNEWRTANDWPPFATQATSYYLGGEGKLLTAATAQKISATYSYDPKDPCPSKGGPNLTIPAGPFDQREVSGRPDVLRFATEPLSAPLEVTGNVHVVLYVSSDAPDTDFTAKFVDIYPDGKEILMLDGIRRLKYHNGYEKAEPVAPGSAVKLDIDLWSISLIVNTGHRIGVQISSSNYPRFEKNPNTGDDFPKDDHLRVAKNTVYMDQEHPSALVLPVRAAGAH